ncbi:MAG: zinc transporter ZupT [Anaerolineae bacterium]|nr:zinc transporter ZupT [Anaerolineae bacterium]
MTNVWIALGFTVFAGMATGIGSALAFFAKRTDHRFLAISTGFSAGVMLYVSFVEIFYKGVDALLEAYGDPRGWWINVIAFFVGILIIGLIDNLIPSAENPHETRTDAAVAPLRACDEPGADPESCADPDDEAVAAPRPSPAAAGAMHAGDTTPAPGTHEHALLRMGLFTALAIGIHNFPEGLATFLAALQDPAVGGAIAVAIALHNIPEGISVSVPIFYATGSRRKAFIYSVLSGLSEPIGAVIAYIALRLIVGGAGGVMPPQVMGILFAGVAGVMVYISLDELLPTSRAYGKGHESLFGLVAGMLVMALSLLIMR